jgi:PTH1 family peptidyl-tRNA hydrolase
VSDTGIRLIVGLGNPGREYEDTRHNAGFWFVDALARQHSVSLEKQSRFFGEVGRMGLAGQSIWLLKPTTFMNRSGQATAALAGFYRIAPSAVLVVHDELDLLPGTARLKHGGGHAGHNGLKDIQARLGATDFWRLRLGIGHPRTLALAQEVADFVLHRPNREHAEAIDERLSAALACIPDLVQGRFEAAMKHLHGKSPTEVQALKARQAEAAAAPHSEHSRG